MICWIELSFATMWAITEALFIIVSVSLLTLSITKLANTSEFDLRTLIEIIPIIKPKKIRG